MPRLDGSGPIGFGPKTGRKAGYCKGFERTGFMNSWMEGSRFLGGRRRGFRNMYYQTGLPRWARSGYSCIPRPAYYQLDPEPYEDQYNSEYERENLKKEANMLKKQLEEINERLDVLEEEDEK
ncbi:DUF5320 domain-containing protein [Natranaerobius trueperi]|uniref:DUF5320 domain-containing protein n=1 Tax=Natranaerobius trueperi TaxID=759412 RepID=A0A226BYK1_9FIRM|nr:DUF5320 domain-containing protein [Natranaerobius trueperi]OWZ83852.1 hypothetical protein CDO51_06350 [Natranaerobius trueperi]